jgi:hypothetical protein
MGGTIRYLPYLRVPDLAYKLIAYVHHHYGNLMTVDFLAKTGA